jgi:hypothetical protein
VTTPREEPEYLRRARKHAREQLADGNGRGPAPRAGTPPATEHGDAWEGPADDYPGDHAPGGPADPAGWRPFPLDALPAPVGAYTAEAAAAVGCDPAFVALPLLAALGAAVGNSRRVQLKRGWSEPPLLWAVIVGESGTLKSPALDLGLAFPRERQARAFADHRRARDGWQKAKDAGEEPGELDPPERFLVSDTTLEALALRLEQAPRGLLLARDELAGWLRSFDAYRKGRGGDLAHYLTLHRAGDLCLDRKTGDRPTIYVPRAFLAVTGGIQPGTLQRALSPEFFEAGLAARLLLALPPRRRRAWSEAEVDPDTGLALGRLFDGLWALQPEQTGDGTRPALLPLTAEGKRAWVAFFNAHAAEHADRAGDLAAAWGKLEGYCARLALLLHCCRLAAGDPALADPDRVDERSVGAGAELVRWFGRETERVYGALRETEQEAAEGRLLAWARGRPDFTARDAQVAFRQHWPTAEAAEACLARLVRAGWLVSECPRPGPRGGRPATRYRLR